ncbi:MAG: PP2C family protein-serine/threonine phosphatase [Spirochaetes bacterium]|nr:PP2C family protein-serine/threonine phosphatase [Spirochaetota bacterium]
MNSRSLQRKSLKLEQWNEKIEQQLHTARLLQAKLLPPPTHVFRDIEIHATYLPMEEVGGDFYDFHFDEEKLVVFIADVSGHGIPGAFNATIGKILYRHISVTCEKPSMVMQELNSQLLEYTIQGNFMTAFLGWIYFESKTMLYSNAGHLPLYVCRNDDGSIHELPVNGPSVGWHRDTTYNDSTFQLKSNDRLILHTDGIVECFNEKREWYGSERFEQFIRGHCEQPVDCFSRDLVESLRHFSGSTAFNDDITLVVADIP